MPCRVLYFVAHGLALRFFCYFFDDACSTEIYTLSLHDALPISYPGEGSSGRGAHSERGKQLPGAHEGLAAGAPGSCFPRDRKSTRLNSSHTVISYAVFCLKKKMVVMLQYPDFDTCTNWIDPGAD